MFNLHRPYITRICGTVSKAEAEGDIFIICLSVDKQGLLLIHLQMLHTLQETALLCFYLHGV